MRILSLLEKRKWEKYLRGTEALGRLSPFAAIPFQYAPTYAPPIVASEEYRERWVRVECPKCAAIISAMRYRSFLDGKERTNIECPRCGYRELKNPNEVREVP